MGIALPSLTMAGRKEGNKVYDNLKVLMSRKNITNEVLARLLGVHRDTIANKLAGESEFTYGQAELIHETLFPEYSIRYVFHRAEAA